MDTPIGKNSAPLDARAAADATGGRIVRETPGRTARGVTTDSRAVVPGGAFVALRGDRHDAHAFLGAAVDAGAVLLVVERGRAPAATPADVVEVDDTLLAWGAIARAHLAAWRQADPGARVVGITGSAGKTTTKELCAALLRTRGACHCTAGNLNNRVGLPAVVLQLEPKHRYAVLEMGMNLPGEIAALGSIAPPDVGVIVNVGLAHAGGVGGTLDDVAREKGALFEAVREGGTLVANADDPAVMARAERVPGRRRVTFGRAFGADVRLVQREALGASGSRAVVERAGRRSTFQVPIPGEAASVDFLAALAAAEAAAGPIDDASIASALSTLAPLEGRMHVRTMGEVRVVDDAYNANPASMRAALSALGEMPADRRVAVLGEMKELGPLAEREHEALGEAVAAAGVSLLVSCGGMADAIARSAASRGVEIVLARDAGEAARQVADRVRPGDVVLVKASRSVGAERVVDAIAAREGKG
jgi:UDP-N-acetylmuramoyl-tripeptide--D-alanyl-D-alanine ligase